MTTSIRNMIVKQVYNSLIGDITPERAKELWPEPGFVKKFSSTEDGKTLTVVVSSAGPIMMVNASAPDIVSSNEIEFAGWSKLKVGDEWDPYEGYRIACLRAARDYVETSLEEVTEYVEELRVTARLYERSAAAVEDVYFKGGEEMAKIIAAFEAGTNEAPADIKDEEWWPVDDAEFMWFDEEFDGEEECEDPGCPLCSQGW